MANKKFRKLPISAVMVIRNEEVILERALRSFCDVVDETIIVHDGKCSDRSLEIARKYTEKVIEEKWIGQAERHRVKTYAMAKNDWVIQIDADEYLSPELKEELGNLISSPVGIYEVSWSTFFNGKHHFWHRKRALFRKSQTYFVGISHESVNPISKNIIVGKTDHALLHKPAYNNSTLEIFRSKWKKWAAIQARQLLENFSSIPKWNCPLDDWEQHRRIRLQHPILLGMIATPTFHAFHCLKNFLKHKNPYILKAGFFAFLYHIHLYYYLNKYKKDAKG